MVMAIKSQKNWLKTLLCILKVDTPLLPPMKKKGEAWLYLQGMWHFGF